MTTTSPERTTQTTPRTSGLLRARLWLGALAGCLVAAAGVAWVVAVWIWPDASYPAPPAVPWLGVALSVAALASAGLAWWLDRAIVGHLRGLNASLERGQVTMLRELPATTGWGELSSLGHNLEQVLSQHRQSVRAAEELSLMREQLARLTASLERWVEAERWASPGIEGGSVGAIAGMLERGLGQLDELHEQNLDAARQVGAQLEETLAHARESAEQAERGFVEATALITTVREIQRLGAELSESLAGAPGRGDALERMAIAQAAYRDAARAAIAELVESSAASVEHLARGLGKVQQISDQVQLLANRSTLIGLQVALATPESGGRSPEVAEETRHLARDVRAATQATAQLAGEIEREIAAASERMRAVRARVAGHLDRAPGIEAGADPPVAPEAARLLDRVREMIQDAMQKGERVSASAERASRSVDRLVRTLEDGSTDLAGLVARLSPPATEGGETPSLNPTVGVAARPPGLKLLSQDDLLSNEAPDEPSRDVEERP